MLSHLLSSWVMNTIAQKGNLIYTMKSNSSEDTENFVQSWNMFLYLLMVKDQVRMEAYRQAIQKYAKDKVVLEIGTGALAPLARMSAEAGAKKVYAIEANKQAIKTVRKELKRHNMLEKIEILEGFSSEITLPEKPDIIVHELIGIGSSEGMARIISDAKKRLLEEKTTFIPLSCKVNVAPVIWQPFNSLKNRIFNLIRKANKRRIYQKDTSIHMIYNFPLENLLAEPREYENIIFSEDFSLTETREIKFFIKKNALFNGFLFWNEITVSEHNVINTFQGTCWANRFISFCPEPFKLLAGDNLILKTSSDLRINTKYEFNSYLMRGEEKLELGVRKIGLD